MITIIAMVLELHRFTAFLGSFFPSQDFLMWCYCWSPIKAPPPLEFKLDQEMPILPLTDLQRCLEILNKLKSDKLIGETCSAKCLSLITLLLDLALFGKENLHIYFALSFVCNWGFLENETFPLNNMHRRKSFKQSRIAGIFSFDWFAQFRHLRRVPIRSAIVWQLICLSPRIIQTFDYDIDKILNSDIIET